MLNGAKVGLWLTIFVSVAFIFYGLLYTIHKPRVHLRQWNNRMKAQKYGTGDKRGHYRSRDTRLHNERGNETDVVYIGKSPVCTVEGNSSSKVLPSCNISRKITRGKTANAAKDITVNLTTLSGEKLDVIHGGDLQSGGLYRPRDCLPNQRVAIIVPYRERPVHLKAFLNNIHPFLKKQKIEYMIIVVEQAPGSQLNRGMLRNIGFVEGEKLCNFDCYIFHDVDMIPLREDNIYTCGNSPRHHAAALARWNYRLPYAGIFGGVVSFKNDLFKRTNGYSNMYFGWGGEDDDLYKRVKYHKMNVERYPMAVSRYGDLRHVKSETRTLRYNYLRGWKTRVKTDGLSSLKYRKYLVEFRKLYTWIYVGINEKEIRKQIPHGIISRSTINRGHKM